MAQTERSPSSNNDPASYPQNVAGRTLAPYLLDIIRRHLTTQAPRLFTDEAGAALNCLDLRNGAQGVLMPSSPSAQLKFPVRFLAESHQEC